MAEGPATGLVLVEGLARDGALDDYHLFDHAARADMLRRVGRRPEAATAYERAFIARRLGEVRSAG